MRNGCRIIASLVSVGVALLAQTSASKAADDFKTRFDYLRSQPVEKVGRDTIVAGYQKLIDDHPGDARAAEAMFNVAALFENENTEIGMLAQPDTAIEWFRKAAETAPAGSEMWIKSRQFLARRIPYSDAGVAEAKQLLEDVANASQSDSLTLAQVEHDLVSQSLREDNLEAAEKHCNNLLNWYSDPSRIPKEPEKKLQIDKLMSSAASGMVHAWARGQAAKPKRVARIQEFTAKHADVEGLAAASKTALQTVEQSKTPRRSVPPPVLEKNSGLHRFALVGLNAAAVVLIGSLMIIRRYRRNAA